MENLFASSHDHPGINIRDAIHINIQQSKAILTCIMFATEFVRPEITLDASTLYHALWSVDDHLEKLALLFQQLEKLNLVH